MILNIRTILLIMIDPVYELSWPRSLFEWEARQILNVSGSDKWVKMVEHLLAEAFHDASVAESFARRFAVTTSSWGSSFDMHEDDARTWLKALLRDEARLRPYKEPVYWAERNSNDGSVDVPQLNFLYPRAFLDLVETFQQTGYFPKVLPAFGVDEYNDYSESFRLALRRATKIEIPWPLSPDEIEQLPDAALYSLIEYLHDQAARPRTTWYHEHETAAYIMRTSTPPPDRSSTAGA